MSIITSIATAVAPYEYKQSELSKFMQEICKFEGEQERKMQILYERSGIQTRYSVIEDYKLLPQNRKFYPPTPDMEPFPNLEKRMEMYFQEAPKLCKEAILKCLEGMEISAITHLITVSCTGMSAPGLDIQLIQELDMQPDINRTSVNFMGCYAAIHGLKQADYICRSNPNAQVLVICVELCSLHFQKDLDMDAIASNLLFSDGAAAVLVQSESKKHKGLNIQDFYSYIELSGKSDMAWHLSSKGFLMTLSAYIPALIEKGFKTLVMKALQQMNLNKKDIHHWAIHPGGRKILEVIFKQLEFTNGSLDSSYDILKNYGNMSSPTVLFVLKDIWDKKLDWNKNEKIFGAAFGPGLTMETFVLESTK